MIDSWLYSTMKNLFLLEFTKNWSALRFKDCKVSLKIKQIDSKVSIRYYSLVSKLIHFGGYLEPYRGHPQVKSHRLNHIRETNLVSHCISVRNIPSLMYFLFLIIWKSKDPGLQKPFIWIFFIQSIVNHFRFMSKVAFARLLNSKMLQYLFFTTSYSFKGENVHRRLVNKTVLRAGRYAFKTLKHLSRISVIS